MPSTPTAAKEGAADQLHSPSNRQDVELVVELRKNPKNFWAEDVPRGWNIFAKLNSEGEPEARFITPTGKILDDFKVAHRFLTQNPKFSKGTPQEMEPGIWIEAEMQEPDSDKKEWLKARVSSYNKKKREFKARIEVENAREKGAWDETYKMSEEGTEWRWPRFSSADLEPFVEEALEKCRKASGGKSKSKPKPKPKPAHSEVEERRVDAGPAADSDASGEIASPTSEVTKAAKGGKSKKGSKAKLEEAGLEAGAAVRPFASKTVGDGEKSLKKGNVQKGEGEHDAGEVGERGTGKKKKKKKAKGERKTNDTTPAEEGDRAEEGGEEGEAPTAWSQNMKAEDRLSGDGSEGVLLEVEVEDEDAAGRGEADIKIGDRFYSQQEVDEVVEAMGGYEACCEGTTGGLGGGGMWIEAARRLGQNTGHYKRASAQLRSAYEVAHGLGAPVAASKGTSGASAGKSSGGGRGSKAAEEEVEVNLGADVEVLVEGAEGSAEPVQWVGRRVVSTSRAKGLFRVEGTEHVFFNVRERGMTWKWPGEVPMPMSPHKRSRSESMGAGDSGSATKRMRAKAMGRMPGETVSQVQTGDYVDVKCETEEGGWLATRVLRMIQGGVAFKVEVPESSGLAEKYQLTDEGQTWRWSVPSFDLSPQGGEGGAKGKRASTEEGLPTSGAVVLVKLETEDGKRKWRKVRVKKVFAKKSQFKWVLMGRGSLEGVLGFADVKKLWKWPKRVEEAGTGLPPCIGATVEVLFSDGVKYPGTVTGRGQREGSWHVLFEDGDEDDVDWPDPDVVVTSQPKQGRKGKKGGKADPRIQLWSLVRVVFTSGVYLGKVIEQQDGADGARTVAIAYEDGFVDTQVELPDPDIEFADTDVELTKWLASQEADEPATAPEGGDGGEDDEDEVVVAAHVTSGNGPWWFKWPVRHGVEDAPNGIRSVIIKAPKKPRKTHAGKGQGRGKKGTANEADGDAEGAMPVGEEGAAARKEGWKEARKAQKATAAGPDGEVTKSGRKVMKRDAGRDEDGPRKEGDQEERGKRKVQKREGGGAGEEKEKEKEKKEGAVKKRVRRSDSELSKASSGKGEKADAEGRSAAVARTFGIRKDLERLLLQETPEELLVAEEDQPDWLDPVCVFMMPTDALNQMEFCLLCGSAAHADDLIFCRDCGDCFHNYCLQSDDGTLKIPMDKRHMWRCPACRICEECQGEENWEQMVLCDECDRGFHMYCLKPPLKQLPSDGWRCTDCRQCVSCKRTNSNKWYKDHKVCQSCWPLFNQKCYCRMCKKVYKENDNAIKMVQCDECQFWVHISCGGIDEEAYKKMQKNEDVEWNCPKCKGDVDPSDDEQDEKAAPLADPDRVVQMQQQLEEFCGANLKALIKSCETWERQFRPQTEEKEKEKPKPAPKEGKDSPLAGFGSRRKRGAEGVAEAERQEKRELEEEGQLEIREKQGEQGEQGGDAEMREEGATEKGSALDAPQGEQGGEAGMPEEGKEGVPTSDAPRKENGQNTHLSAKEDGGDGAEESKVLVLNTAQSAEQDADTHMGVGAADDQTAAAMEVEPREAAGHGQVQGTPAEMPEAQAPAVTEATSDQLATSQEGESEGVTAENQGAASAPALDGSSSAPADIAQLERPHASQSGDFMEGAGVQSTLHEAPDTAALADAEEASKPAGEHDGVRGEPAAVPECLPLQEASKTDADAMVHAHASTEPANCDSLPHDKDMPDVVEASQGVEGARPGVASGDGGDAAPGDVSAGAVPESGVRDDFVAHSGTTALKQSGGSEPLSTASEAPENGVARMDLESATPGNPVEAGDLLVSGTLRGEGSLQKGFKAADSTIHANVAETVANEDVGQQEGAPAPACIVTEPNAGATSLDTEPPVPKVAEEGGPVVGVEEGRRKLDHGEEPGGKGPAEGESGGETRVIVEVAQAGLDDGGAAQELDAGEAEKTGAGKPGKVLTDEEKAALAEKASALSAVKKELQRLEKGLEKHRYQRALPFFDDVLSTLIAQDAECIAEQVQQLRATATELFADSAPHSELTELSPPEPEILHRKRVWATMQIRHAWTVDEVAGHGPDDVAMGGEESGLSASQGYAHHDGQQVPGYPKKKSRPKKPPAQGGPPASKALQSRVADFVNAVRLASEGNAFTEFKDTCQRLHKGELTREAFTTWFRRVYSSSPQLVGQLQEVLQLMADKAAEQKRPQQAAAAASAAAAGPKPKPKPVQQAASRGVLPQKSIQQAVLDITSAIKERYGDNLAHRFIAEIAQRPKPLTSEGLSTCVKNTFPNNPEIYQHFILRFRESQAPAHQAQNQQQQPQPQPSLGSHQLTVPQLLQHSHHQQGQAARPPLSLPPTMQYNAPQSHFRAQESSNPGGAGRAGMLNSNAGAGQQQQQRAGVGVATSGLPLGDVNRMHVAMLNQTAAGGSFGGSSSANSSTSVPMAQMGQAAQNPAAASILQTTIQNMRSLQQVTQAQKMIEQAQKIALQQNQLQKTSQAVAARNAQPPALVHGMGSARANAKHPEIPSVQAQPFVLARVDGQQPLLSKPVQAVAASSSHTSVGMNGNGTMQHPTTPQQQQPQQAKPKRKYVKKADKERMEKEKQALIEQAQRGAPPPLQQQPQQQQPRQQQQQPQQQQQQQQQQLQHPQGMAARIELLQAQQQMQARGGGGQSVHSHNGQQHQQHQPMQQQQQQQQQVQSFNATINQMRPQQTNMVPQLQSLGLMPPMPVGSATQNSMWGTANMQKALGINSLGLFPMHQQLTGLNAQSQSKPQDQSNGAEPLPQMDGADCMSEDDDSMLQDDEAGVGFSALPQVDGGEWDDDHGMDGPVGYGSSHLGDEPGIFSRGLAGDESGGFGRGVADDDDSGSGWAGSRLSNDFKRGGPNVPVGGVPSSAAPAALGPSTASMTPVGADIASKMFPAHVPFPVPVVSPSALAAPVAAASKPLPVVPPALAAAAPRPMQKGMPPPPVLVRNAGMAQGGMASSPHTPQALPSPLSPGYNDKRVCQIGGVKVSRELVTAVVQHVDCGRKDNEGGWHVNWAAVAQRLGIDTKSNHSSSKKLKDLYYGVLLAKRPFAQIEKERPASATGAAAPEALLRYGDGGKVSVDMSLLENPFNKLLKISGADGRKDSYIFHAPSERIQVHPRKGGLLARKPLLRRAAERVQTMWVYSIHEAINRSETAQKAAKRKKQKQVEGWDMKQLGRLIEACATALGVLHLSNGALRLAPASHRAVVATDFPRYAQQVKRALSVVSRDSGLDIRYCVLCKLTGDRPVQGRLLYVEKACWVHASCICWSSGVYMNYKVKPERLCKVHDTVRKAQSVMCSFCACPGATVACSNPGCGQVMHFGCAVMCEFTWYPLSHAFCPKCKDKPFVKNFRSTFQHDALTPLDFNTFLNRHLHIMPRSKPRVDTLPKKRKLPPSGPPVKDPAAAATPKPPRAQLPASPSSSSPSLALQTSAVAPSQAVAPPASPAPSLHQKPAQSAAVATGAANTQAMPASTSPAPAPAVSAASVPTHTLQQPAQPAPSPAAAGANMPWGLPPALPGSAAAGANRGAGGAPGAAPSAQQMLMRPAQAPQPTAQNGAAAHPAAHAHLNGAAAVQGGAQNVNSASNSGVRMLEHAPSESRASTGSVEGSEGAGKLEENKGHLHQKAVIPAAEGKKPEVSSDGKGSTEGESKGGENGKEDGQKRAGKGGGKQKRAEEVAAVMAAREEREREEREKEMNEDLDAFESNQVSNLANDMQQGSAIARVGSLTVHRLGKIRTDNDAFHSELAIYPVGYMSTRLYFAPGEMPIKGGPPMRRCLYRCQILADEDNGRPLFTVTVNNVTHTAPVASEAWEKASQRKLRERKKLRVHANEGQCDNVTEMFMACSYAIDGDYMFGITVAPIAKSLEALKEAPMLFNYNQRFDIWGKNYVRPNPSGCARSEPFKRRKKMSTAKVHRNAEEGDETNKQNYAEAELNASRLRQLYHAMKAEPRAIVRRSPIHNFGLFATRQIDKHDMVIEYMGELVRQLVGDMRDDLALEKGKSTYMFRIDEEHIVDAMFKGNASRYINHCCQPNCYCKVVTVDGVKHIVLFALRDIRVDEEITYDYKLPIEDVKVICQCGAPQCRGYLN